MPHRKYMDLNLRHNSSRPMSPLVAIAVCESYLLQCKPNLQQFNNMADDGIPNFDLQLNDRFVTIGKDDINTILDNAHTDNTKQSMKTCVRLFWGYLIEKRLYENFGNMSHSDLDAVLKKFYEEVRTRKGDLYKRSSLTAIRHGINRHLQRISESEEGESRRDIDISVEFRESNRVMSAMGKEPKRNGKGGADHKIPINVSEDDLLRMYQYFDTDHPVELQQKVFVDIVLHLARRGRENMRALKKVDFQVTKDARDTSIFIWRWTSRQKIHQSDDEGA